MKTIWKPLVSLLAVAVISIGLLLGMNWLTGSLRSKQDMQVVKETFAGIVTADTFEAMSVSGAKGVQKAWRALDRQGKLLGYAVTVTTKGYGGDMQVHVGVSADTARFLGLRVGNNMETEDYGSRVTEAAFYEQFNSLAAPAQVNGYTGLESGTGSTSGAPVSGWKDGTYTALRDDFDKSGYRAFVELTVKNGKITAVNWDAYKAVTKKQESRDGTYVMTETGLKWHEQAALMEKALLRTQDPGKVTYHKDTGKTDAYTGVSVKVDAFVTLAAQALETAKDGGSTWKDGTWRAQEGGFHQGYQYFVEVTVKDGKITTVNWDATKETSSVTKKQLSQNGEYVMTEDHPKWHEQAKTMENALIKTQDPAKLVYDKDTGKTDAYAGVSVTVSEMVELSTQALQQALEGPTTSAAARMAATKTPVQQAVVNTAEGGSAVDAVSGATVSSKAVVRAANQAWQFLTQAK